MIVIFGAGGMGREIAQLAKDMGHEVIFSTSEEFGGMPPQQIGELPVLIAVADPKKKQRVSKMLDEFNVNYTNLIASEKMQRATICKGSIVQEGAILTTNVKIGQHVFVNLNVTIGHDCTIGDFTTISPAANISGNVKIGKRCYIGTNASIKEGITICDDVTIGMGSVVLNDIEESGTYAGIPAKKIK